MSRILFTIKYCGSNYHGWQVQPNGITVQQTVQAALEAVFGKHINVTGCSRTDAGVHANMFCFHSDIDSSIPIERLPSALNASLPSDIAVLSCNVVDDDFHARYSCKGKNYIYKIYDSSIRDPFKNGYAFHYRCRLNENLMNIAAKHFIGTHDFAGFCSAGSSITDTVRTVSECNVSREGDLVTVSISADGFLYNMVRIIVGTLIEISEGKISIDDIDSIILSKKRCRAGRTAVAHGLYLNKVYY